MFARRVNHDGGVMLTTALIILAIIALVIWIVRNR